MMTMLNLQITFSTLAILTVSILWIQELEDLLLVVFALLGALPMWRIILMHWKNTRSTFIACRVRDLTTEQFFQNFFSFYLFSANLEWLLILITIYCSKDHNVTDDVAYFTKLKGSFIRGPKKLNNYVSNDKLSRIKYQVLNFQEKIHQLKQYQRFYFCDYNY